MKEDIATGVEPGLKTVRSTTRIARGSNGLYYNESDGHQKMGERELVGMAVGDDRISVGVPVWGVLLSSVVRSSFDERIKNCFRLSEVVVNDVDEE